MLREIIPYLLIIPATAYSILVLIVANGFFARKSSFPCHTPPVTVIKPVKGVDEGSYKNFASFCTQNYENFQLIFTLSSEDDPVIPVIKKLINDFPKIDIQFVINSALHTFYGPNYKVVNLINAIPFVKHDIIIISDSDIRVRKDYLKNIVAPFYDEKVGLVTSLYRSPEVHGITTALESLGFTAEMIPNVLFASRLEGLTFALGASIALRKNALERIGGFEELAWYLADDYQLGNKIYKAGYSLELSCYFVESIIQKESVFSLLSRQIRWGRTIRVSRPGGYFASVVTYPFLALILVIAISGLTKAALYAIIILYSVRFVTALIFSLCYVKDGILPKYLWLLPFRDALSLIVWALAFMGNSVTWRGKRFFMERDGRLKENEEQLGV
ncbi:MAG: bacteriohopanetetrol glucosamine biosynthesis glycosyltransferase HpnI [Desulfuromonadales bacterium]|nr:bacteriohopanetetrol glucosamine biosynthesis glycosyltransferase HpnI [Desulfuromonadales bacterium]